MAEKFVPDPLPQNPSMQDLLEYIGRQQDRIANALEGLSPSVLEVLHAAPAKPFEMQLVAADGVDWNPGQGKGPYIYINGDWMFLGQISTGGEEEPEPPEPEPDPDEEEPPPPPPGTPTFFQTFEVIEKGNDGVPRLWLDQGLQERTNNFYRYQIQSADPNTRCVQMNIGRHGSKGILLRTSGSDTSVSGSGSAERCDLNPSYHAREGDVWWFAHSVWIPPDFLFPPFGPPGARTQPYRWNMLWQFHDQAGNPPLPTYIFVNPHSTSTPIPHYPTMVTMLNSGSPKVTRFRHYHNNYEQVEPGNWYDFFYNIKWTVNSDGFLKMWRRGPNQGTIAKLEIDYTGPTYAGNAVAPKPANYHSYAPGSGNWTEVGHDRIILGDSVDDLGVADLGLTLEGVP